MQNPPPVPTQICTQCRNPFLRCNMDIYYLSLSDVKTRKNYRNITSFWINITSRAQKPGIRSPLRVRIGLTPNPGSLRRSVGSGGVIPRTTGAWPGWWAPDRSAWSGQPVREKTRIVNDQHDKTKKPGPTNHRLAEKRTSLIGIHREIFFRFSRQTIKKDPGNFPGTFQRLCLDNLDVHGVSRLVAGHRLP